MKIMTNEEIEKIIRQVISDNPQLEMHDVVINKIVSSNKECIVANLSYIWIFNGWEKTVTSDRWFVQENNRWKVFL